jgi:hypothetical protein
MASDWPPLQAEVLRTRCGVNNSVSRNRPERRREKSGLASRVSQCIELLETITSRGWLVKRSKKQVPLRLKRPLKNSKQQVAEQAVQTVGKADPFTD